jgi:Domain of unknown function (DUF4915)
VAEKMVDSAHPRFLDRPQLLISIANVAADPRPSCLLHVDTATERTAWVDIGVGQPLASGTGIFADDLFVYHVCVVNPSFETYLVILDRQSLEVAHVQQLPEIADVHSIVRLGDELIIVSTETDQILAYSLDGLLVGAARQVWSPTNSGQDTHHINSLAVADGELFCSAFGPRDGDSWTTATNGYIRNVSAGVNVIGGLRQPHSATWNENQLYFCNSFDGSVNTSDSVVAYLYGYTRGLAFGPNGMLYTGTSRSRRPSQSTPANVQFANPGDQQGDVSGQCALVQMTVSGMNRLEFAMTAYGNEIYDILAL